MIRQPGLAAGRGCAPERHWGAGAGAADGRAQQQIAGQRGRLGVGMADARERIQPRGANAAGKLGGRQMDHTRCIDLYAGRAHPAASVLPGRQTTVNTVQSGSDVTEIVAPWISQMCLTMDRPRPVPGISCEREASAR